MQYGLYGRESFASEGQQAAGYSPEVGSVESQPMFDFLLAEELLTAPVGGVPGVSTGYRPEP